MGQQPHNNIARLNPDGSLDATFNPDVNGHVIALAIQPDNKILVGGDFNQVNGQVHAGIARLNPYGDLDSGFEPQIEGEVLMRWHYSLTARFWLAVISHLLMDSHAEI